MPLPKKNKKHIPLTYSKTLYPRRQELVDKINEHGTYLPKSILHSDLDGGFLSFVKNDLKTIVEGKTIPMIDILMTTQNWSQFTETWNFQNLDKNVEPPFITVVRVPEVKYGTNPALIYNIPNRRQYYYAKVPTWDGQRQGMDIYKIPQPVPVDISFTVKIMCNRMRELNEFNKNVLEMFASRQAYATIKGHYIPIIAGAISDESVMEIEKRKYYIQSYEFTMLGFLIDENEFEVSPAITRVLQVIEFDKEPRKRRVKRDTDPTGVSLTLTYPISVFSVTQVFDYTVNISLGDVSNVDTFDVYINGDFYGSDLSEILINTNDVLRIEITKQDNLIEASIKLDNTLI